MTAAFSNTVLITPRLRLRSPALSDAPAIQQLAGDPAVANNTLNIPHPYVDGLAEEWIRDQELALATGSGLALVLTRQRDDQLIGVIGLTLQSRHSRGELGYWIGRAFWGKGYATEAARAMVAHGFNSLGLHRVHACHFCRNPASGRVLQKAGLRHEGRQLGHICKAGQYEDIELYGITRELWEPGVS
jgi:RimJ/RimL family protein N-acetyltransferase